MKLVLKDGTEIAVLDSTTSTVIRTEKESVEEIETVRKVLSKENLTSFRYTDDAGNVYGKYENFVLENVSYTEQDGKYLAEYTIRQLSDVELRLDALETGQETQDGAIEELASIIGGE